MTCDEKYVNREKDFWVFLQFELSLNNDYLLTTIVLKQIKWLICCESMESFSNSKKRNNKKCQKVVNIATF